MEEGLEIDRGCREKERNCRPSAVNTNEEE